MAWPLASKIWPQPASNCLRIAEALEQPRRWPTCLPSCSPRRTTKNWFKNNEQGEVPNLRNLLDIILSKQIQQLDIPTTCYM